MIGRHVALRGQGFRRLALSGCSAAALIAAGAAAPALADPSATSDRPVTFDIAAQDLAAALNAFALQSGRNVMFQPEAAERFTTAGITGDYTTDGALSALLDGTGLAYSVTATDAIVVRAAEETEGPQSTILLAQAETGGASTGRTREKIIVTGQKRDEYIQDVPIAISAFSQDDLTLSQIAGGPDLITQIPNFTFTKTNFSGYSIQIRGIGTQAISATTDPAVAVAFNNTPFIRNRFFEQEFYDMERVEVLRGPQGTLYGRNATAGVVNLISAKPSFDDEARASVDLGNFNSRRMEAMINLPLVDDQMALRVAGAWTDRDGYATNAITDSPIDGRDLWSTRVSLRAAPNDRLDINLIWEHFEEDDDRLRSGKQLCHKDVVEEVGGLPVGYEGVLAKNGQAVLFAGVQALFSTGCERGSLYDEGDPLDPGPFNLGNNGAFETPNGFSLPYYLPLGAIFLPTALNDPYSSTTQSKDLRVIESTVDPVYRAKSDIMELQISWEVADGLTLESETAYGADEIFSTQDFNRFNTQPGAWKDADQVTREGVLEDGPFGGIFCDPQLGCADRLVAVDLSSAESRHFSQEFRLASQYGGPFNFSLGANYLRYDTEDKYYVFINSLSLIAALSPYGSSVSDTPYIGGVTTNEECLPLGPTEGDPNSVYPVANCTYIDPNPIGSLNDQGHNYFLSRNPFKLISYAAFGEAYWNLTDNLKLTGGLRWSVDRKEAPRIPSWTLASNSVGYPVAETIKQKWTEPTGRLVLDWKPELSFTDETLLYGSYAHGYKAGGANPPPFVKVYYANAELGFVLAEGSATKPKTFEPEFVDAFEVGAKNTFFDGDVTVNAAAFFYDYEGYQVSEIVDRQAFNRNFDAEVWGLEIETEWWALENLRLSFKGGYEKTRIADGEQAVDLMDRTAGNEDWMVVRPFPTQASSCILPVYVYLDSSVAGGGNTAGGLRGVGNPGGGGPGGCEIAYLEGTDPQTRLPYVPNPTQTVPIYPAISPGYIGFDPLTAPNNGEGFFKDIGGNELPNAPNYTATLSGDYILPLGTDWTLTFHTDLHYQSESWWRVFQDHEFSRLNEYYTMNLAAILKGEDGWNVMGYIKNVTDETAITGAFLNSDDTGLTTNVFLTEPRLYGVRITKDWTSGTFLGRFPSDPGRREAGEPFAFNLLFGGQVQQVDAPYEPMAPSFASLFSDTLDPLEAQNRDLDTGDSRQVKLSYRPNGGRWNISAGVRYGKTNGDARLSDTEPGGPRQCVWLYDTFYGQLFCNPEYQYGATAPGYYYDRTAWHTPTNWSARRTRTQDEHQIIDFVIGKDIGVGSIRGGESSLAFGLRFANFETNVASDISGVPDYYIPEAWAKYYSHFHRFDADVSAERQFEGTGPIVSWDASTRLLGDDRSGRLDLDWSIAGGVLFGKQKTSVTGSEQAAYYYSKYSAPATTDPIYVDPLPISSIRTKDVEVPVLDVSLGLSFNMDRVTVGAGYRWERYYDAMDGGYVEQKDYDRTMDGPYFNVSIGFGG